MSPTQLMGAMLVLPLLGAAVVAVSPKPLAKHLGVLTSLLVFGLSIILAWQFPEWTSGGFWPGSLAGEVKETMPLALGVSLTLGIDSVALLLILLTTFLTPLALLGSYTSITSREREFYGWFLVLLSAMLLAFMARDAIAFYIGYEFTIVPMLFLIAIFGGENRRYAAVKFFVFTFVASVLTLAGIIYVAAARAQAGLGWSFGLAELQDFAVTGLTDRERLWVFIAMMIGFCVKVPLFPVHSWLPLAHDQAPTGGSVILAGTLLKLGTYGIYRIALPMAPDAAVEVIPVLVTLSIIAIVAISLVCVAQKDVKRLVAYSSVSHMGVAMLGLLALNPVGLTGSVMYMINHGLSTGALFLCIGMMYERYHTKEMDKLGGLAKRMPIWAFFMIFFTMTSVGLPGLNGFVSEVLCLLGAFAARPTTAIEYPGLIGPKWMLVAGLGSVVFGALYMLYMVGRVVWGPLKEPGHGHGHGHGHGGADAHRSETGSGGAGHGGHAASAAAHASQAGAHGGATGGGDAGGHGTGQGAGHAGAHGSSHAAHADHLPADLTAREIGILVPIAAVCLLIGVQPWPLLDVITPSAKATLAGYPEAVREHLRATQSSATDVGERTALVPDAPEGLTR
jgi:NADH-quinone oxidoreductase subunit M